MVQPIMHQVQEDTSLRAAQAQAQDDSFSLLGPEVEELVHVEPTTLPEEGFGPFLLFWTKDSSHG